jgi:hypothetical protein
MVNTQQAFNSLLHKSHRDAPEEDTSGTGFHFLTLINTFIFS